MGPIAQESRLAVAILEVVVDLAVVGLQVVQMAQCAGVGEFRDVEAALALVGAPQGDLFPFLVVIPRQINAGVALRLGEASRCARARRQRAAVP